MKLFSAKVIEYLNRSDLKFKVLKNIEDNDEK
jgi:hypothetical protein